MGEDLASALQERVAFLQRPDIWPDQPLVVRAVETHFSWVFLTRSHAFKLKKPMRYLGVDRRSVEARRSAAEEEVAVNRRLAPEVYRGFLPVVRTPSGDLAVGGSGTPVDYLVWMRRLPEDLMLDGVLRLAAATPERLVPAASRLARFYHHAPTEPIAPADYLERLRRLVRRNRDPLLALDPPLARDLVEDVHRVQESFLQAEAGLVGARGARVVEAHGDLRPEHVYLGTPPAFIDALDFGRDLRLLDPVDELAFLGMSCEVWGPSPVERVFLESYGDVTGDQPPRPLVDFYQALRACTRARLLAVRCGEDRHAEPYRQARWHHEAEEWLRRARVRTDRLSAVRA